MGTYAYVQTITAHRWRRNGDHPDDGGAETEGKVVRYYRNPYDSGSRPCLVCGALMHDHGWLDDGDDGDGAMVCPGDWIVDGPMGRIVMGDAEFREAFHEVEAGT